jgi:hypothetical protein
LLCAACGVHDDGNASAPPRYRVKSIDLPTCRPIRGLASCQPPDSARSSVISSSHFKTRIEYGVHGSRGDDAESGEIHEIGEHQVARQGRRVPSAFVPPAQNTLLAFQYIDRSTAMPTPLITSIKGFQ